MLVNVLGLLDLISASIMVGGHFGIFKVPLLYAAIYLLVKLFFWRDTLSFIDAAAGVYCIFLFFGAASGLTWLFALYFSYKTAVWLFYAMAN